jgi:glycosyltransferase involved in cell wall biosynthesis
MDVEIVIPAHNERFALEGMVRRLHGYLTAAPFPPAWRIVIADSASTDGTLAIARRLSYELEHVEVLHLDQPGRERALRLAWSRSDARTVYDMDVDLSADPAALLLRRMAAAPLIRRPMLAA